MKEKTIHRIGTIVGLCLFVGALAIIHHTLKKYNYSDILSHLQAIPEKRLYVSIGLSFLSYLVMTGYDALALHFIGKPLSYAKIALASFIGYSFSHNVGFNVLSGAPARFRIYSRWGLSTVDIAKVVAFCGLTFWLGFFSIGGVLFLVEPPTVPEDFIIPQWFFKPFGIFLLCAVIAYLIWSAIKKKPLKFRGMVWEHPPFRFFFAQMMVSTLDWAVAARVLYSLIPAEAHVLYFHFLGFYLIAQIAGLISQVPGGLGVFETVMLFFLTSKMSAVSVLGLMVAYRGIYYLLPLVLATLLLGIHEVHSLIKKIRP